MINGLSLRTHNRLRDDFSYYADQILRLRDDGGVLVPLRFNQSQMYLHKRLEEQKKKIGKVRVIIVKGRKQGMSTYVAGRFYHASSTQEGKKVFILSHDGKTTIELFNIVKRFHNYSPEAVRPLVKNNNRFELSFEKLDSSYTVGTAGNEGIGLGFTPQYFHGSEVGHWGNAEGIRSGIFNAVPDRDGTEVILESTAKGEQGIFYEMYRDAVQGKGEFIVVFCPWYWKQENQTPIPKDMDFVLDDEEKEIVRLFPGLTNEQLYWRRNKIVTIGRLWLFKQEYPFTADEAFQSSGKSFIPPEQIFNARHSDIESIHMPVILGVDPAWTGDRTALVYRQGRKVIHFEILKDMDGPRLASILADRIENFKAPNAGKGRVEKIFIDWAAGKDVADFLKERGFGRFIEVIHFNLTANDPDRFSNLRSEMIFNVGEWFREGCSIPDNDEFVLDIRVMPDYNPFPKIKFPPKKDIKKSLGGLSPDIFDALALTFARPVISSCTGQSLHDIGVAKQLQTNRKSELSALNRIRSFSENSSGITIGIN